MKFPTVGQKVILQREVDRAHEFIAPVGTTGTVTLANNQRAPGKAIHVLTDQTLSNGENLIVWNDDGINRLSAEFWHDCKPL